MSNIKSVKRIIAVVMLALMTLTLAACGGTTEPAPGNTPGGAADNGRPGTPTGDSTTGTGSLEGAVLSKTEGVDIDLTIMSSTVAFAQVADFMYGDDEYIGKVIKMSGIFSEFHDKTTGKTYYGCIVPDASACCANGIEFVPADHYAYPDDYPEEGDEITIVGVFSVYDENGYNYITLKDAEFIE